MRCGPKFLLILGIVLSILFALAAAGYYSGGWNIGAEDYYQVASAGEDLQLSKYDALITKLDKDAAANAYREQIEHLFAIWMKDPTGQPARAAAGAQTARKAFIAVMDAIERREKELEKLRELSPAH